MSGDDGRDPAPRDWALIAYLCADNQHLAPAIRAQVDAILRFTGSAHLHVAVQWDLPDGAERAVFQTETATWEREPLDRVNTGDPETFLTFLRWAFDRCPSEHVIVVAGGTGLLDPRAAHGGPETDRGHLFTICEDGSAADALSLSEIGRLFRKAVDVSTRSQIDILALDMRELQCLEVAYELEGSVDVLIAPQTRIPDAGWNFATVLAQCDAALGAPDRAAPPSVHDMARLLVRTVGAGYEAGRQGLLSLSALDLHALKHVAPAFDTLSLAMVHSVGEELVWKARDAVARRLKPKTSGPADGPADAVAAAGLHAVLNAEEEYLYDLPEMLGELRQEFEETASAGLLQLVLDHFEHLDASGFERALLTVDDACFTSGSRLRFPLLQHSIADARGTRRRLRQVMTQARRRRAVWSGDGGAAMRRELAAMFMHQSSRIDVNWSWLDGWPEEAIRELEPALAAVYRGALRQQQRLRNLAALTERVLSMLRPPTGAAPVPGAPAALIVEHFTSAPESMTVRHGGVSLFRPRDLDQLIASDYLDLRFNRKIHWTVLLAVINLIGKHPRGLWRILSAVLATADNTTRAQLISRITGPGSVIAAFREQFVVLAPVKAFVLSLEPDPNSAAILPAYPGPPGSSLAGPQAYRVRLELAERDAFISEVTSIVDPGTLKDVVDGLVGLLKSNTTIGAEDARRVQSLGETLGEDILQDLGLTLASSANGARERIHLQLQIPRELMKYPWELMHHKGGWLSEHFALGRQVFSRMGNGAMRARAPGPLRALVIGNPLSEEKSLPYAASEARLIAAAFESFAAETDGLIDFDRQRDTRIDQQLTRYELRQMLRHGNYDIVHFAGHAAFSPGRPDASAWLLSDGPFSAQAIRNTLRWREIQPWLVFANACEAAMDGDQPTMYQTDVFGLASAFLDHGVSVFIGPLWRIDDNVAAQTARSFYEQLLKERQTVGEALRHAKAEAKHRHFDPVIAPRDEPGATEKVALVSWAGLVLYGNSTATIGQRVGAPPPVITPLADQDLDQDGI